MIEFLGDVVGEFEVLFLVVADRHAGRVIGQDVGRHEVRIDVKTGRGGLAILSRLVLELGHAVEPADAGDAVEDPGQPRMGRHGRLVEEDVPLGIDPAGDDGGGQFPRLLPQRLGLLPGGDGMQIDDTIKAIVFGLQGHPVADRAEIVAERRNARRLYPGEYALHVFIL